MTNQIKGKYLVSLLYDLQNYSISKEEIDKKYPLDLSQEEAKILLDYITNLQEENEYNNFCNEKLREKITNLEYKISTYENIEQQIDKALEYIKEHTIHDTPKKLSNGIYERGQLIRTCGFYVEDLLDILRGDE